ncbi:hypothetical protein Taro_028785 [Colocasia esculenta]|uniref:Uncharacterized protein n=1 Tax=Colocasia esculenta TaxID=4460 RepID=A0A843VHB4_COLES|nr:hypothetical protein [Colocasia esculenta]
MKAFMSYLLAKQSRESCLAEGRFLEGLLGDSGSGASLSTARKGLSTGSSRQSKVLTGSECRSVGARTSEYDTGVTTNKRAGVFTGSSSSPSFVRLALFLPPFAAN